MTLIKPPKKRNYLNNRDMLEEIRKSRLQSKMTDTLVMMLLTLCDRYAKKSNFANYSYIADMKSYAILNLVKIWGSFDENKSSNPFSYYTQSIKNSFIQFLNQERRQRNVKDQMLVHYGLDPSYNFMMEYADENHHHPELNDTDGAYVPAGVDLDVEVEEGDEADYDEESMKEKEIEDHSFEYDMEDDFLAVA